MQLKIDKKTQIAWIIETRKPLVDEIEQEQHNLRKTALAMRAIENLQQQIMQSGEASLSERVKNIQFSPVQEAVQVQLEVLEKLKARFSRNTLNIGVIGRARQGKSRLLQSLSGLSSSEIPDGELGACTGVRSTVTHNPDDSYAEVYFYTEDEFLRTVLVPYYSELELGSAPTSVDQFASSILPPLPQQLVNQVTAGAKYGHLKKYREQIREYRPLLRVPSPQKIALSEVRNYVAQQTEDGQDIYNHRAVREVKIYCPFPYAEDVEQVAFIDMPGLGDTGMGDEERLIKALGEDIDVALLVRKPVTGGDLWSDFDTDLYDKAQHALQDLLPLHQWAFLVLNHTRAESGRSDNLKNCRDLESKLNTTFMVVPGRKAFVESIIVDCSDPEEVNQSILEPILSYLLDNINKLDRQYAAACMDGLAQLRRAIADELQKAQDAFGPTSASIVDFTMFQDRFEQVWTHLTNGLESLVAEQRKKSAIQNPVFVEYFNKRFEICKNDSGIPTIARIRERRNREGAYMNVYNTALHEIRTRLTYHFINLDDALKLSMNEVKDAVAQVFLEQGKLASISSARGHAFFQEMTELIQPDLRHLRHVFYVFAKYELSYRGFFQQRIRARLELLVPDRTPIRPNIQPNMSDDVAATEVHNALKKVYADTLNALYQELAKYLTEPSGAAFVIMEEFVDQAIRAENAQTDWSRFYRKEQERIWATDFGKLLMLARLQQEWLACVEKAQQENARRVR